MLSTRLLSVVACALAVAVAGAGLFAQQAGPAAPPARTARQSAQADLTGNWVAQVTEDWRWRMMTPPKGDYMGLPLNAAGRKVGDAWDLARDAAEGKLCKAFGAGGIMRHPMRIRITWVDDNTLKLETDAGRQTRLFHFDRRPPGPPSLQGLSAAQWSRPVPAPARGDGAGGVVPTGRAFGPGTAPAAPPGRGAAAAPAPPPPGGLKVVTTNLLPGYLRKNGVPYSENALVTEYYDRISVFGADYLQVVTEVADPTYLTRTFIVSNHFKREADGSKWNPTPCTVDAPAGSLRREPFVAEQR